MIKSIEFENFRNLNQKYTFSNALNVVIGKNNSGKTNLLDGIRLAFSLITGDYFRVLKSDFKDSNEDLTIKISVELDDESIPTLVYLDSVGGVEFKRCGFKVIIKKNRTGRYLKELTLLNGSNVDYDILGEDEKVPNIYSIPLLRIEDIYTNGLSAGISRFIESEQKYLELKNDSKMAIKEELREKEEQFKKLTKEFNQSFKIEVSNPRISDEKVYIVDGEKEHNFRIGSGYKSVANILLNTLERKFSIILIDEIENHLHPSLIRVLVRKLQKVENVMIVSTTHSSVVINELQISEIIDISGVDISFNDDKIIARKLNTFLHPGRNELLLADNVILVEGYTEELLFRNYLRKNNKNWTIINVAGVMFEPYILLANRLYKNIVVISDNDISTTEDKTKSKRFNRLESICKSKNIMIIEVDNTLETDLFNNGFLKGCESLLKYDDKHNFFKVAKPKMKMSIIEHLIDNKVDLYDWHVIRTLKDEFQSN